MPIAEVLQPEAGDDRNKDVEIAKLEEIYNRDSILYESDTPGFGPGDIVFQEYRLTPLSLEMRREKRYLGRKVVGLTLARQYPLQTPQPSHRAHIKRTSLN